MTAASWDDTCLAVTCLLQDLLLLLVRQMILVRSPIHVTLADLAPGKRTRANDDLFDVAPEVTCSGASRSCIEHTLHFTCNTAAF